MIAKHLRQRSTAAEARVCVWRTEAPANRFMQYMPGEVAARFVLPLCILEWGYPLEGFYDPKGVRDAREDGGDGFQNHTLREDLWVSLNRGEPLAIRDNLLVLFRRGSLFPEDFAAETQHTLQLSKQNPQSTGVSTTFERTDIFVDGALVRQYGLNDWQNHFEEISGIFAPSSRNLPALHNQALEESRLEDAVRAMFQPLSEAFQSSKVMRVLRWNPAKPDIHACAVQALGYLCFLRAAEETYPFDRNFLRRIHWAYSGEGREAYGDVTLAGSMWADISRLIRGMAESPMLSPYLGYKFPDRALRRKLWTTGDKIDNELIQAVLEPLVCERFGILRAIHFGPVLGRLLSRVREHGEGGADDALQAALSPQSPLWLTDDGTERQISIAELRALLEDTAHNRLEPAFRAADIDGVREVAEWVFQLRVRERHTGGPIFIAQAAEALSQFQSRLTEIQGQMRTEMQHAAGHLFAEEEIGSLGPSTSPDRSSDDGGPYWKLFEAGILRGDYATAEEAELAELSINILNLLHADRSPRHPKLVKATNLRHFIGRFLTGPGFASESFPINDRPPSSASLFDTDQD